MAMQRTTILAGLALAALPVLSVPEGGAAQEPRPPAGPERLEAYEARGWLGVAFRIEAEGPASPGHPEGGEPLVLVERVADQGPAREAGLRPGDRILRMDGVPATLRTIRNRAGTLRPGDGVTVTLDRNGDVRTVELRAGERPPVLLTGPDGRILPLDSLQERLVTFQGRILTDMEETRAQTAHELQRRLRDIEASRATAEEALRDVREAMAARRVEGGWLPPPDRIGILGAGQRVVAGAELAPLNPGLARYFGTERGVLVVDVTDGTPSHVAGLLPGDVIHRVNGVEVDSVEELRARMEAGYRDPPVRVDVFREGGGVELRFGR